ncbi:hypothetical protein HK104_001388, partial [Borealophlyctis nickersoniae]
MSQSRSDVVVVRAPQDPFQSTDKKPYRASNDSGVGSEDDSPPPAGVVQGHHERHPSNRSTKSSQSNRRKTVTVDEVLSQLEDAIHSFDGPTLDRPHHRSASGSTLTASVDAQRASVEHKFIAQHRHNRASSFGSTNGAGGGHERRPSNGSVRGGDGSHDRRPSAGSVRGGDGSHDRRPSAGSMHGSPVIPTAVAAAPPSPSLGPAGYRQS